MECVERNLDPFTTNLVVADSDRSTGTLCLAITPAMKALGIKNRCGIYINPLEQMIKIVDTVISFENIRDVVEDENGLS